MLSLSTEHQDDIITAFNNTSRCLADSLNVDNNHFSSLLNKIYPYKLQLNKANSSDKQSNFLDIISWFYISQLVRFSRACKDVKDFYERNLSITEKNF
jgi:hypothetical protein